jgi:hypothetical protein
LAEALMAVAAARLAASATSISSFFICLPRQVPQSTSKPARGQAGYGRCRIDCSSQARTRWMCSSSGDAPRLTRLTEAPKPDGSRNARPGDQHQDGERALE